MLWQRLSLAGLALFLAGCAQPGTLGAINAWQQGPQAWQQWQQTQAMMNAMRQQALQQSINNDLNALRVR